MLAPVSDTWQSPARRAGFAACQDFSGKMWRSAALLRGHA